MALTQESVLFRLINEGGQVKKSEMVSHFRGLLDAVDPAEKQRNRELFKTFVNSVATVREIDGVRYVVLKKVYQHLLNRVPDAEEPDHGEIRRTGEPRSPPERAVEAGSRSRGSGAEEEGQESPAELLSPVELALRRSQLSSFRPKKMPNFEMQQACGGQEGAAARSKPCALPLRIPARVDLKLDPPDGSRQASPQSQRRSRSVEHGCSSPQLRRAARSDKAPEELREPRASSSSSSSVPLEDSEHKWLLRCAAGHWRHVHGLLLADCHLAQKRDFMSGFTALHWAAKWGNSNMLVKIIDLAKKGGVQVDINAKTHGGYTPLHIAALHNQEYMVAMLVGEYDADPNIRDNCGKRPHHYLRTGASESVREMLVKAKAPPPPGVARGEREEPDLARGRHSMSRLFPPYVAGQRKKLKQRTGLSSLSEEFGEEWQDGAAVRNGAAPEARV